MARQAVGLVGQLGQPRPAALLSFASQRGFDVAVDGAGRPALGAARDALDFARRQAERLAQLPDRPARSVGREGGDEGGVLAAVALVHARDEDLADVAREVEVDVGERGELLVEEAPEEEVVGDRVDVREAGEVADDRGDGRASASSRRQERACRGRASDLRRDLARQLEHVAVQEEEAGEVELRDDPELLLEPRLRLRVVGAVRVAVFEEMGAQLSERAVGGLVLRARVAVAEVGGEVEGQALGERCRFLDRLGMVGEPGGHRLGRGQDVGVVAAALGLGGVERGVQADGDEGVLELGAGS